MLEHQSRAAGLLVFLVVTAGLPAAGQVVVEERPATGGDAATVTDAVRAMQEAAELSDTAAWGHWGDQPHRYAAWSNHSNRLVPVYAFGLSLEKLAGPESIYRDAARLEALYGRLPEATLNPRADYFDQADIHRLQLTAADSGKRRIIVFVFDGLDWTTTRAAAIHTTGRVAYDSGRGEGLAILDYRGVATDFGFCVTSPANDGTQADVDAQAVRNPGGRRPGGYDAALGGSTPWDPRADATYLIGQHRGRPHAYTDSAASATSIFSGIKTYNDAINVDPAGRQVEPVARTLQRRGWATGVVTSVPISHATAAAAYANNVSRDDYQDLSRDMLGLPSVAHRVEPLPGLDVVIGCGEGVEAERDEQQGRNYEPGNKYLAGSTLAAVDAAAGGRYRVARRTPGTDGGELLASAAAEAAAEGHRLLGFFGTSRGHLPYATADGRFDPVVVEPSAGTDTARLRRKYEQREEYLAADIDENPSLAEMATAAVELLGRHERFWLLVEAGDVDWASHANNIDDCIGAIAGGDTAFAAVVAWIETHGGWDDTAVIVTSDHGHMFVLTDPQAFTAD